MAETRALTDAQRARVLRAFASRLTDAGELILASDQHRSQRRNREEVRARLAQLLREALVPAQAAQEDAPDRRLAPAAHGPEAPAGPDQEGAGQAQRG